MKTITNLLLVGGGGHCLSIIDCICRESYASIGIVDLPDKLGGNAMGVPYVGVDDDLPMLATTYNTAFISIGSVGTWGKRHMLKTLLEKNGYAFDTIIHPSSSVSAYAHIMQGVFIAPHARVNILSRIGEFAIINTSASVDHECEIAPFAHIAPGAVLCGNVTIGYGSHVGAGSVVRQGIKIGDNVLIGAGSVVTSNIPANSVAYGIPCKPVRIKMPEF